MPQYKPGLRIRSPVSGTVYELGEYLGRGGFGVVCRARPVGPYAGAEVCVKFTEDQASWHCEAYFGKLLAGNDRAIQVIESFPHVGRHRESRPRYCLVLERARHGALADWLATQP